MINVSIILVGYNSWTDLQRCLPSVFDSVGEDAEVVVVDNCSSDATVKNLPAVFPKAKLIVSSKNLGFGGANNLAAQATEGKYLIFLNPDTFVMPGWVAPLLAPLQSDPNVGMTTAKILQLGHPEKINACGNDVHLSGMALCRGMNAAATTFAEPETVNAISGAAFAISREYFAYLGGFDETYFLYVEDTDLSLRCLLNGRTIQYVPESVVYHDYTLAFGPRKIYYQERNRLYMLQKILRPETRCYLAPLLSVTEWMTWGYSFLRGGQNIRNKREAMEWIRQNQELIRAKFTETQKLRKRSDSLLLGELGWKIDFKQTASPLVAFLASLFFYPLFYLTSRVSLALIRLNEK